MLAHRLINTFLSFFCLFVCYTFVFQFIVFLQNKLDYYPSEVLFVHALCIFLTLSYRDTVINTRHIFTMRACFRFIRYVNQVEKSIALNVAWIFGSHHTTRMMLCEVWFERSQCVVCCFDDVFFLFFSLLIKYNLFSDEQSSFV